MCRTCSICARESRGNPATLKVVVDNSVRSLKQITGDLLVERPLVIKPVKIISELNHLRIPIDIMRDFIFFKPAVAIS